MSDLSIFISSVRIVLLYMVSLKAKATFNAVFHVPNKSYWVYERLTIVTDSEPLSTCFNIAAIFQNVMCWENGLKIGSKERMWVFVCVVIFVLIHVCQFQQAIWLNYNLHAWLECTHALIEVVNMRCWDANQARDPGDLGSPVVITNEIMHQFININKSHIYKNSGYDIL